MDRIEPREDLEKEELHDAPPIVHSELNIQSLRGYFGIEVPTTEELKTLNEIYRMAVGDETHEMVDILLYLRGVENKIGAAPLGEKRMQRVYNYMKLMESMSGLEKQRAQYEQ
jgi:hypothetical protein